MAPAAAGGRQVRIAANVWNVANDRLSRPSIKRTADRTYTGHTVRSRAPLPAASEFLSEGPGQESVRTPPVKRFIPIAEYEVEADLDGFMDAVVDFSGNVFLRTVSFISDGQEVTQAFTKDRFYVNLPNGTWTKYDAAVTPGKTLTALSFQNNDLRLVSQIEDWTSFPGTNFLAPGAEEWRPKDDRDLKGIQVLLSSSTCRINDGPEAIFAWPRNSKDHFNFIYLYAYDAKDATTPLKLWARFNVEAVMNELRAQKGSDWGYNNERMVARGDCSALFIVKNDKIKVGGDEQGNSDTEGNIAIFSIAVNPPLQLTSSTINLAATAFNRLANMTLAKPPIATLSGDLEEDYPRIKDRGALLVGFVKEERGEVKNIYEGQVGGLQDIAKAGYGAVFATKMRSPIGYDPLCIRHALFYSTLTVHESVYDKFGLSVASVWPIAELDCSYGNDLKAFGAQAGALSVHPEGPFVAVGTQSGVLKVYPLDKTRTIRTNFVDPCLDCNTDKTKNSRSYSWSIDGRLLGHLDFSNVIAWKNANKACAYPYKYQQDSTWTWVRPLGARDLLTQEPAEAVAWTKASGSGYVAAAGVVYPLTSAGNPDVSKATVLVDNEIEAPATGDFLFMSSAAAFSVNGTLLAGCHSFIEKNEAGTGMCKISKRGVDCSTKIILYLAQLVDGAWKIVWKRPAIGFSSSRCRRALVSTNIDAADAGTAYGAAYTRSLNGPASSAATTPFLAFDTRSMILFAPFDRATLEPLVDSSPGNTASVVRVSPTAARAPEGVPADPEDYVDYSAAKNNSKGPAFTDISIYNPPGTNVLYITGRSVLRAYSVNGSTISAVASKEMTFSTPYELRASNNGRYLVEWSSYTAVKIFDLGQDSPASTPMLYEFGAFYKGTKRSAGIPVLPFIDISDDGEHIAFEYYPPESTRIGLAADTTTFLNSGYEQTLKMRIVDLNVKQLPAKACSLISRDVTNRECARLPPKASIRVRVRGALIGVERQSFLALTGDPCKGRGTFNDAEARCTCTLPYGGLYCDEEPQDANNCKNGGKPDAIDGGCSCNAGRAGGPFYYGADCSKQCPNVNEDCSSRIIGRL
eukprot:tig00001027_g6381.t1